MEDAMLSAEVISNSLRTLILKCIPPAQPAHPLQFSEECLAAARTGLRTLIESWEYVKSRDDRLFRMFVHSTLLFVPFVPFIVLFGNTIAQKDRDDLALLEKMVIMLQHNPEASSPIAPSMEKFKIVCERFVHISQVYMSQQEAQQDSDTAPTAASDGSRQHASHIAAQAPIETFATHIVPGAFGMLPDFSWDEMFNEWELGLGAESAREAFTSMPNWQS
jgi:hypothetical protein